MLDYARDFFFRIQHIQNLRIHREILRCTDAIHTVGIALFYPVKRSFYILEPLHTLAVLVSRLTVARWKEGGEPTCLGSAPLK